MSPKSEIGHVFKNVIRRGYGWFVFTSINGRVIKVQTRQTTLDEFDIGE
jgi:hypothetical protein